MQIAVLYRASRLYVPSVYADFSAFWKETQRLWPPFYGGRRLAEQAVALTKHTIPSKRPVVYVTRAAHRDGAVFHKPNTFDHTRWSNNNVETALFTFGAGRRACVGETLMAHISQVNQLIN